MSSPSISNSGSSKAIPIQNSKESTLHNNEWNLSEKSRKLLMKGIEVLAHREHEQEGLEIYISEGRQNQTCLSQFLNVIRWLIWSIMIILNIADPIVILVYAAKDYSIYTLIFWLALLASVLTIIYAFSISLALSYISIIIAIILRCILYSLRKDIAEFHVSIIISISSFIALGVCIIYELIDEARNSCK